jgi:rubrerythrin
LHEVTRAATPVAQNHLSLTWRTNMPEILSDSTYNLLAMLLSKLEGLEAYDTYLEDMDGEGRKVVEQISRDDERHAQLLRDTIERLVREKGLK